MQSYLQYHRFKAAVKAQVERNRARAQDVQHSPHSSATDESKLDVEKGIDDDDFAVQPTDSQNRAHGVNPGEVDPNIGPPLPDEEEQTMQKALRPEEEPEEGGGAPKMKEEQEEQEGDDEEAEEEEDDDFEMNQQRRTLSRTTTQHSIGTALGTVLTGINIRKRSTKEGGEGNVFVVGYEDNDPLDPHNWSFMVRIPCTFLIASIGCVVGIASAIDSSALQKAAADFGVSEVVESMATGLFLVGFGAGSLFAGPISETVGRNPVYITTLVVYMIFIMASGLAPNIGAQLAFRFLAGFFGSTPLTCAGEST